MKSQATPFPDTAIYTNAYERVKEIKESLYDIWEKSRNAAPINHIAARNDSEPANVDSLWDQTDIDQNAYRKWLVHIKEKEEGTLTEKDVINKIINAKRLPAKDPNKDMNIQYGSYANAVIYSPESFNVPDMIIKASSCNKHSSFGAEDQLDISLLLETPKGYAFVPVVHITDNAKAAKWRKGVYAGTPAGQNTMLVKKDELKVTVQGNTLFACWTKPIPIYPPKYTLPPACILFEGYGELKTEIIKTSIPSGRTQTTERNSFKAFVTLFHPTSTYRGAEAKFNREYVMTAYPPPTNVQ
jgi:hypothetical protein